MSNHMKITTKIRLIVFFGCALLHFSATAATTTATGNVSHPGPAIKVVVQRGDEKLPVYWVNHLRKGDRLIVTTDQAQKTEARWLLLLATVTPVSNLVETRPFDLSDNTRQTAIDITSDDQIPVIVLAPEVRTMFGLHTSFSESAALIADAIKTDPQRFIDLQKIDRINHAINYLLRVLDAQIQTKTGDQAISAAKDLAARFGVKYIDPDCFKDAAVNTKCVAANIVSSADLLVPSDEVWSAAGPNGASVKLPTDIFAGMKIITDTSTYLVNKYGDNYDFAPALGQRLGSSETIQLFTNARFKSGDVKTAYIYVPSWFEGKTPTVRVESKKPSCLTRNELSANVKGNLPLLNYWHDWKLVLRAHGPDQTVVLQSDNVAFHPDTGLFILSDARIDDSLNGQLLDATLSGKFGFTDVTLNPFPVVTPVNEFSLTQVDGLNSLIAGEQAKLTVKNKSGNACVAQLNLQINGTTMAGSMGMAAPELNADLSKTEAGPATLEIVQYGAPKQELSVAIYKRRAHLQKILHHDLEPTLTVVGDNLDRIDRIQLSMKSDSEQDNILSCRAQNDTEATPVQKVFTCPADLSNASMPDKAGIRHRDDEPAAFDFPVTKINARPHMTADGANAIVTRLSATALQWNLSPNDQFISEDSGLGLLLHAFGGYKLSRGTYQLQLKFTDDPASDAALLTVPLMSDLAHNELRSKKPITFESVSFPSVVNPVWYRVLHQNSGLAGDWQPLNRSVIYLPQLTALSHTGQTTLIHGSQLELIDSAGANLTLSTTPWPRAALTQCGTEQCLELNEPFAGARLKVKLHWIDNRIFDVTFPEPEAAETGK